jgi:hypothetical protein
MATRIEFIAQPEGVKIDRHGEVQVKLVTSQKYRDQAMLLGALCDGETLVKVTIEPHKNVTIGIRREPNDMVDLG